MNKQTKPFTTDWWLRLLRNAEVRSVTAPSTTEAVRFKILANWIHARIAKRFDSLEFSRDWYRSRIRELQRHQDKFPDPYREYICGVIANGKILPAGVPPVAKSEYEIFADIFERGVNALQKKLDLPATENFTMEELHRKVIFEEFLAYKAEQKQTNQSNNKQS